MDFIKSIKNNIHEFSIPDRTNIKTRSISIMCDLSSYSPYNNSNEEHLMN